MPRPRGRRTPRLLRPGPFRRVVAVRTIGCVLASYGSSARAPGQSTSVVGFPATRLSTSSRGLAVRTDPLTWRTLVALAHGGRLVERVVHLAHARSRRARGPMSGAVFRVHFYMAIAFGGLP